MKLVFSYEHEHARLDDWLSYRALSGFRLLGCAYRRYCQLYPSPINGAADGWKLGFIRKYGRNHASPNSGYPEAALASILDCQFGGPHKYFGEMFYKPFIGDHDRELSTADMKTAVRINRTAEFIMVIIVLAESLTILLLSR